MASLDLGTLIARIKVEGASAAQSALNGVSSALGRTTTTSNGATSGVGSFSSTVSQTLGNVKLFGTDLGTMATAFGSSNAAGAAMGAVLGGVVSAGVLTAVSAMKELVGACVEFVTSSLDVGEAFQAQMSKVAAISGATNEDLNTLTSTAKQLGKDTVFSATEVAQAMEYTALAGWKTEEAVKGLPAILNLAAASSMDLGKASDIVTDYLTAFGLEVEDSTRLVDVMAYAMGNTNTNTEQLGEAYKMTAGTCNTMGVSLEEATAWLGLMANAGYKGEQAGSALNAVLGRLYGETKTTNDAMAEYGLTMYDNEGKAKNFTSVMGEIETAMSGMTDQQQNVFLKAVAGTNQMSKFAVMLNATSDEAAKLTTELENAGGTSEKMMNTMNDNISGLKKSIGSKLESIKLSIFNAIEPIYTFILTAIEKVAENFSTKAEFVGQLIHEIVSVFNILTDVLSIVMGAINDVVSSALKPLTEAISGSNEHGEEMIDVFKVIATVIGDVISIIGIVTVAFGNLVAAVINALNGDFDKALGNIGNIGQYTIDTFTKIKNQITGENEELASNTKSTAKSIDKELSSVGKDAGKDMASNYKKNLDDMESDTEKSASRMSKTMKKVSDGFTITQYGSGQVTKTSKVLGAYANGTDYVPSTGQYLVGERGPEIVTLRQGSSITPNHALGGNTNNTFNISINASDIREFNDIVSICGNARMTERMA